MQLSLHYARKFTYQQRARHITQGVYISLTVSGMEYSRLYDPDGNFLGSGQDHAMTIVPPGFISEFSYGPDRENIVLICDIPGLKWESGKHYFTLDYGGSEVLIRPKIVLSRDRLFYFRNIFERIIRLKNSPVPGNLFMAEQLTGMLLAELAVHEIPDNQDESAKPTLAELLKKSLDQDSGFRHTLQEHCRRLGYSAEYMRRCFCAQYAVDPQEYRMRRKLERIMELLADDSLTAKAIAAEVGMKHVTHLHGFVRQRCGISLRELSTTVRTPD